MARGQREAYPLSFRSRTRRRNLLHNATSCILRTLRQNRIFSFLIKKDGAAILTPGVPYTAEEIEARMR
jgi:hypothetical protein